MRTRAGSPAPGESSEDPASDGATAVHAFERRTTHDRRHWLLIERGFGIGRPNLIALSLEVKAGALRKAPIVGASGALEL
jgi:predicted PhzF superfamily epimerase YddE/YHI9